MCDKILIVDDDDLVLECFERMLGRKFHIETAVGPDAALEALQSHGPYAVLMSDLRMPRMSGVQLLEKAKELSPNTVGILITGNIEIDELKSGAVYKALEKPCQPTALADALTEAITHHHNLCGTN